ncbi:hypothetical protein BAUCODRAFT_126503 [Baudoinia panamericana UAMH 10762]|uniref:F-box domain-containing protein n=1 Tax=Baudoinia panamericana (strain UAMH 10762) TaxID=717646 RepID=M2MMD6_BAUPA|nr:uncharacterized protein BAUCODRAFT_126503 [Baudoinia panamericana UAMH 10762]EMC92528.1 hypothetical protein BAUCODRAFT_126503 [Baudoinia panamericana UAMH 10762]
MKKPITFPDLPAELRTQIYGYLVPDRPLSDSHPDCSLRDDGLQCSTNFMACCKQVQGEAADLLYADKNARSLLTARRKNSSVLRCWVM